MGPLKTLEQACKPRQSVFDQTVRDTVYNIDDLAQIDANAFFAENYVTEGMQQLLTEAFQRLEGKSSSSSGTFLLSQSMGGGKTHNLLALGLLAKYPSLRRQVMGGFYEPGSLGAVRVVTFSGREKPPFGIWGNIAEQVGQRDTFKDFYSPLTPPGVSNWVALLRGEPTLIMLDELPPYFQGARSIEVGATTLDVITTTALANLFVAVASDKLPNVCVVLTDLRASAYGEGSAAVTESLRDLEREANRSVTRIDPVRLQTDELYHIMRTRLFERVAEPADAEAIAAAYREAVDEAKRMDLTTASPDNLRAEIARSYPFHPGIRDLFARFRENPGFQQTRALIRIMRIVVADLWTSRDASRQYLIGAHDLDLHRPDIASEIRQINSSLDNAVAHDIASDARTSVAETIDGPGGSNAQDAATLIFLSSLSQAVNPTLGLTRSDIVGYLAAPGRDITTLRAALDELQSQAWYLHATGAGALLFKNTENLIAKLESYAQGMLGEQRETEIRARLETIFEPQTRAVYQRVLVLPALDQVQPAPDQVTLVVFKPSPTALEEITRFFEQQLYKNRLLFLTSDGARYGRVLERAAYLRAISTIIAEFRQQRLREDDPQLRDALELETREQATFYQACREAFQTLYYPSNRGLTKLEITPQYGGNRYEGETIVQQALAGAMKYTDDIGPDGGFVRRVEERLWPQGQKEVSWADIKRNAAQNPGWVWHHPSALDDLRAALVMRDTWRAHEGGWVERGPFPKPATGVSVQRLLRDPSTGEATLRVRPLHGDVIHYSEGGQATTASPRLESFDVKTRAARVSFLCVDTTGQHETGEPETWTNEIEVKYELFERGGARLCELRAYPGGEIVYTIDGSSPETSGLPYSEPFEVADDARVLQARARLDGVISETLRVNVPPRGRDDWTIDANRPAVWKKRQRRDATGETFDFLAHVDQHHGALGGTRLAISKGTHFAELLVDDDTWQEPAALREQADLLQRIVPGGSLSLDAAQLRFSAGRDLSDLAGALRETLQKSDVEQR
jgi:hypothetical protein